MKHLFNDLSSQEKNRILEMHKRASDNLYLTENVNYNEIMNSVEGCMSEPSKVDSIMNIWNDCKRSNKYVRLKSLPPAVITALILAIAQLITATLVGGPVGFSIGALSTILTGMSVTNRYFEELKKGGADSESLKQEITMLYNCIKERIEDGDEVACGEGIGEP